MKTTSQQSKNPQPHSLEDQLKFVKGGIEVLEKQQGKNKEAEIVLDKDNLPMLKAIEESLGELKLSE